MTEFYVKCTYNKVTFMFFLTPSLRFDEIVNDIVEKFGIKLGSFGMKYSLPMYPSCIFSCESDLKLLRCCMVDQNVQSCDIVVSDIGVSSMVSSTSSCIEDGPSMTSNFNDIVDPNEYLGSFRLESSRTYLTKDWVSYISHVNQKFEGGATDFKDKLKKYAIEVGFVFKYKRNHPSRVKAFCSKMTDGCKWSVTAKLCKSGNGSFYIHKLNNEHSCKGVLRLQKNKHLNARTISTIVSEEVKSNPSVKPKAIISTLKTSYGLDANYRQALSAKVLAISDQTDGDVDSYSHMLWYYDAILASNPGSHCVLESNPITNRFERFFVSFAGCIKGFVACVPILFVDAAHLKGKYKGVMLCATGKNGNDEFYPLAFAVVANENKENWFWYMEQIRVILAPQGRLITFFSDRNSGLMDAITSLFPESPHSYCFYHLRNNVLKCYEKIQGKFDVDKILFFFMATAYAPTEKSYNFNLNKLQSFGGEPIKTLLKQLDLGKWNNAHFDGRRYGVMSNSIAESFNSWTSDFRDLPIFQMFETLRVKLMESMARRSAKAELWTTTLCPVIEKLLVSKMDVGRHWVVNNSSSSVFEVQAERSVSVDLGKSECSCKHWQIDSFPCSHALAAIQHYGSDPVYLYIEPYFGVDSYKHAYAYGINPIPTIEAFYENDLAGKRLLKPPLTRVPSGRPKGKRIKSSIETSQFRAMARPMKCGRCKEVGHHNKSSCTKVISN